MQDRVAFIFDMDGVIIDNMQYHVDTWLALFRDKGHELSLDDFLEKTAGKKAEEVVRMFLGESVTDADVQKYAEQKDFLYRYLYRPKLAPLAGFMAFVEAAKSAEILMGVGTGGSPENIEFVLGGLNLKPYFKTIVGAANVSKGKPDPEIYLKAADQLGIAPENCIVFEDALPGLEAARRAGMKSVAITTSHTEAEFAAAESVFCIAGDFTNLKPLALIEESRQAVL
ncbi:beta-phosphoglucomutase family hydrolase [Chloroherpeton thalassium ATCC 35110]|uniref:Beta-phosphoglucomutase n=1 Tax=Chloroherpeton thalassium (strain ATCC 35110 / GB-78) TaxID=517418 RepID=B3QV36_CHLT3|nr:HAD family phosphatase [Chloroherpeton thalassium]ACF12990.1 beta-phosphoglucomutase family hydrolase [Chloroherpeton thalassium ATCC 35110]